MGYDTNIRQCVETGNEPLLDGEGIMMSWGKTWPRVIARAWLEEQNGASRSEWYAKLLSRHPDHVLDALIEEGFMVDAFSSVSEEQIEICKTWFKKNIKIVVAESTDTLSLNYGDKTTEVLRTANTVPYNSENVSEGKRGGRINGWKGCDGLEHVLVLTLPPRPEKPEYQAIANADYVATGKIYPFTVCC